MGMVAILVMWPEPFEQTFVPLSHGGSIWNVTLIGQAVSEEKLFKECGRRRRTTADGNGACLYYELTYEPKGSGKLIMNWAWMGGHSKQILCIAGKIVQSTVAEKKMMKALILTNEIKSIEFP